MVYVLLIILTATKKETHERCVDGEEPYLHVGREERQLQRPPVLHAAGDHAGEYEPAEAHGNRGFRQLGGGAPAAAAADAHRELELAVAARRHDGDHRSPTAAAAEREFKSRMGIDVWKTGVHLEYRREGEECASERGVRRSWRGGGGV